MSVSTTALWARYNRHTNQEMTKVLEGVAPGLLMAPLAGYFGSIFAILDHLYSADLGWTGRLSTLRSFEAVKGFRPLLDPPTPGEPHFESMHQFRAEREALDVVIERLVAELTEDDLATSFAWRTRRGEPREGWYEGLWMHVFNHQTHHRGMIALALDQLGVENDYSNLVQLLDA